MLLTPPQIKPKSFESRRNFFFTRGGCVSCFRAWLGARLLPQSYKFPKPFGGRCRKATLGVCTGGTPNGSTGGQPDSRVPAKVNFGVESHSQWIQSRYWLWPTCGCAGLCWCEIRCEWFCEPAWPSVTALRLVTEQKDLGLIPPASARFKCLFKALRSQCG